jgi:hypothetical protein
MSYTKISPTFIPLPGLRPLYALSGDLAKALVVKKVDNYQFTRGNVIAAQNHCLNCLTFIKAVDIEEHVSVADAASLDKSTFDTALEFWIKAEDTAPAAVILNRYDALSGEKIELTAAGKLVYTIGDGTDTYAVTSTTDIRDGKWHHVFAYADRDAEAYIYLDAVDNSASRAGTLANVDSMNNALTFLIGKSGTTYATRIKLEEVRSWVWAAGIPATIATAKSENMKCPYVLSGLLASANVILWLKFDEVAGATFQDSSASNNDGTPMQGIAPVNCSEMQATSYLVSPMIYENAVPHAGTVAMRLKCFWSGNDAVNHALFYYYYDVDNYIEIRKNASNNIVLPSKRAERLRRVPFQSRRSGP